MSYNRLPMRIIYLFLSLLIFNLSRAQTITVSGQCITGTVTLDQLPNLEGGKVAYQGTGTVDGNTGVTINIYWIGDPDNVWVLAFDGQPYFKSSCNFDAPPSSANASCPYTAVTDMTCTGANPLVISGTGVLAANLLQFTAVLVNSKVQLNWKTAAGSGYKLFEIQRSNDLNTWQQIGTVMANEIPGQEVAYSYTDRSPLNAVNNYRLLQKDKDGLSSYSSIVNIRILNDEKFQVINNASTGQYQLVVNTGSIADVMVMDLSGKKLFSFRATKGMHDINLGNYPKGIYLLKAKTRDASFTQKLINP